MVCQPLMIWRPVPDNSRFQVRVTGDTNCFDVQMDATVAGQQPKTFEQDELVPGPAEVVISKGDQATFDLVLNVLRKPDPAQPVLVDIRIVDANGNIVQVADGSGGTRNAQCASKYTNATGTQPASIAVVVVA